MGIFGNNNEGIKGKRGNLGNFDNFGNLEIVGTFNNFSGFTGHFSAFFIFVFIGRVFKDNIGGSFGGRNFCGLNGSRFMLIVIGEWWDVFLIMNGLEDFLRSPEIRPRFRPPETCTWKIK